MQGTVRGGRQSSATGAQRGCQAEACQAETKALQEAQERLENELTSPAEPILAPAADAHHTPVLAPADAAAAAAASKQSKGKGKTSTALPFVVPDATAAHVMIELFNEFLKHRDEN